MAKKAKTTAAEYVARLHASCDQYAKDNDRCAFSARQVNLWDEIHRDRARDAVLSLLRMEMYGAQTGMGSEKGATCQERDCHASASEDPGDGCFGCDIYERYSKEGE